MKIIAANNLHILLLLVTNVLQINNISQHSTLSVYKLVKCIILSCIFTATTTDESCSCPHYCGYTANSIPILVVLPWLIFILAGIPPLLSPLPRYYRCPHRHVTLVHIISLGFACLSITYGLVTWTWWGIHEKPRLAGTSSYGVMAMQLSTLGQPRACISSIVFCPQLHVLLAWVRGPSSGSRPVTDVLLFS